MSTHPTTDEPALFPIAEATAPELRLSDDCHRCRRPYQRCVCVLMPDRRRVEVTT